MKDFFNLYSHGFIRAAVCVPEVRVADVSFNAEQTIGLAKEAAAKKALFALFPELGLSAYSNEDLFHQEALLQRVQEALGLVLEKTKGLNTILVVGAPLRVDSCLFNCGVVLYRGRILGVAVKSYLPNYREFYEGRQFRPAEEALSKTITPLRSGGDPLRAGPAFRGETSGIYVLYRDLRGRLGPRPPVELCRAGRRHGPRQPLRLQHHDRKIGIPAEPGGQPVGPVHRRLPLRRGGPRRVDDGSGLGRSRHDLRERQAAR